MLRLLFKKGDAAVFIDLNRVVLLNLLQVRNVVHGQDRRILTSTKFTEPFQTVAEEIVSRNHDDVVVDPRLVNYQIQIANRAELVRIVGRVIVRDREAGVRMRGAINIGPTLKM